jgi:hypothetical protein
VVYKKKQLNLKVDITGCPDGFDTSTLPIVMSEESVSVITPNLDDPDSEDVTVGSIALSNISPSRSFTFAVPVNTGDINVAGEESVIVSFSSEDYTSKSFTVNSSRIKLKNKPSGYTVTKDTKKLTSVTVYGPTDVIDSLTDEDIYAEVDLSDVYEAGSYTREATVYAKGYDNVWCYGTNSVQVVVTDPATTTTTTTTTTAAAD